MIHNTPGMPRGNASFLAGLLAALLTVSAVAQDTDEVIVVGQRVYPASELTAPAEQEAIDTTDLLQRLPGANANRNGTLTGIAQYRGLYGDRVNVTINGLSALTGGPNAMDAPLSYASPFMLNNLTIERGISSVSQSTESIGGHINAQFDRGSHSESAEPALSGSVRTRYKENGSLSSTGLRLVGANDTHKLALLAELDDSGDLEFPDGTLTPTRVNREHFDLSYGYRGTDSSLTLSVGALDTSNTGTPALPMDIRFIDTQMVGIRFDRSFDRTSLEVAFNQADVDHLMDNYGLRTPPAMGMGYRATRATGEGNQWRISSTTILDQGEFRAGIDGETSTHTARITNPNAPPFFIDNFNDAERDILGVFSQWNQPVGRFDIEAGLRLNHVSMNSGSVSAGIPPANPMMAMNAQTLASAFNNSDLEQTRNNLDLVFKIGRIVNSGTTIYLETAQKTRAPSYQEAYLWLPMQSTGGLADGRSYIGNPSLRSEKSREINLGVELRRGRGWVSPQIFHKDIRDYIQGIPSTNAVANAVALMMSGQSALEFANTDATITGLDLAWGYPVNSWISVEGNATYARGRRKDVDDNLYRLAPLNGRFTLLFDKPAWSARVELIAYASQRNIAAYNNEPPAPGYGIVNMRAQWRADTGVELSVSLENALDKTYRPHLGGINRVAAVDVATGDRIPGLGRSLNLGLAYNW